jgi:2-polyprenyl-6-methoxyphenol hydroxylase-like FAD-dependent oxidoreductase
MKVAIVGAGAAGLSASIYFRKLGINVDVFERAPALSVIGSGIMLQPVGMAVLHELGALEGCLRLGAPLDGVYGTSALGKRVILNTRYDDWDPGAHGLGIHRSVLLEALYKQALQAGVRFFFGAEVADYREGAPIFLKLEQGWSEDGYGALILAGGRNSTLQFKAPIHHRKSPYEWGAVWATVEMPSELRSTRLRQWYRHSSQMLGILPIGATREGGPELCSVFWSQRVDSFASLFRGEGSLSRWKNDVRLLAGDEVVPLLDKIQHVDQLVLASYSDIEMDHWNHGNVLAIGDCAHAMSPQLGQGANMALVDAKVLAQTLQATTPITTGLELDWPLIMEVFTTLRRDQLRYYQSASRALTPLFQSDSRLAAIVRDFILCVAQHVPFARRHAATTLVGGRKGWMFSKIREVDLYFWNGRKPINVEPDGA